MTNKQSALTEFQKCLPDSTAGMLEICEKLTRLEKEWTTLFTGTNRALGEQTAPGSCDFEGDGIIITVHANGTVVKSLKFKETLFKGTISKYLDIPVKQVRFVAGKVLRTSLAKPPSKAYERYAPVLVNEEQIEKEKELFADITQNEELTEAIAKLKALAEKKQKRKRP